ncbi:tyrosine-type recombinase/integrase [Phenylobacterium sp.]|uniref:tyrosine-type recombinase/integrase n=1 Tax=Phenylobacterium sp. TaxID=1871053 RepID=UPI0035AFBA13
MKKRPKGVSCYRDRHGKLWWKFRGKGLKTATTKAMFDSAEWWAWYNAAANGERAPRGAGAERTLPGSLNALAVAYYTSADWLLLSKNTQATYRGILDRFRADVDKAGAKLGDKPAAALQPHNVRALLDARAKTPSAANNLLKVLRAVMKFGVERNMLKADPTAGVKPLKNKTEGFHTWTEEEIEAFDKRWPLGTQERLAKDLLLFTGQRRSDVRLMGPQHIRGGVVSVRQQKTGAYLEIAVHDDLDASLKARPTNHLAYITTPAGEPYTEAGFGNWFSDAARKAGLTNCSAHGLRKAAARRLAEAGCTANEIAAVTGHSTLKEVARYTRAADQRRLAGAAIRKIGGTQGEQNSSNPENRLDKTGTK